MSETGGELRCRPDFQWTTAWRISLLIRTLMTLVYCIGACVAFSKGEWLVGLLMIALWFVSVAPTILRIRWARQGAVADRLTIRGYASPDIAWREVDHVMAPGRWDEVVTVSLTDGTRRRTRFPASYAQQLADLGGRPLR